MSKLRRTLSLRKRRSYSTLSTAEFDMFKTPPTAKITPIKEICDVNHNVESKGSLRASIRSAKGNTFSNVQSTSTPIGSGKENADVTKDIQKTRCKQGLHTLQFPGLSTVKSALTHVGQRLRGGKQFKKLALRETPSMVNGAYTTPRRSERLKAKSTPSPLTLKMYSPFCIETPGDESFTRISKRKAETSDLCESPLAKTPRQMVEAAVQDHKQLAKTLSKTDVIVPTFSGY